MAAKLTSVLDIKVCGHLQWELCYFGPWLFLMTRVLGKKLLNEVRLIPVMPSKHLSYCNNTKNLVALCQCKSF